MSAPLYYLLFAGAVGDLYQRTRAALPPDEALLVSLRVEPDDSEIGAWPWEFAADSTSSWQPFAPLSLARSISLPTPPHLPDRQRPLRVLVTLSGGDAGIVDVLRRYGDDPQVIVRSHLDLSILRQDLNAGIDVWHHCGDLGHYGEDQTLLVRNRDGELEARSPGEIAMLVSAAPPLLVFLHGAPVPLTNASRPIAAVLARAGVAACISLRFALPPVLAQAMVQTFYDQLMTGVPVETCIAAARRALAASTQEAAWAAPVLTTTIRGLALNVAPIGFNRDFIVLEPGATIADALARLPVARADRMNTYILIPADDGKYTVARWDEVEQAVMWMGQAK